MMTQTKKYAAYILLAFILISCHRNPLDVNVSNINVNLKIARLDQDLFKVTPENVGEMVPEFQKKFEPFFEVYNREVLAIGNSHDSLYAGYLLTFVRDSTIVQAKQLSDSLFYNFQTFATQLELAFKHYLYYYPEGQIPQIYTYLSGYNQSIVTVQDLLGVSLDNYLGSNCRFYRQLGLAAYKVHNMNPGKLVYDALYGWASQKFEYKGNTENLVSEMIHQGKLYYFLDAMFPQEPDSMKIGFSKAQLSWCQDHEQEMWSYLVEQKMLFSGDWMLRTRFLNPAPFTTPFGQKSPGRTGVWIGWQIVKSYLKKNPSVSLRSLMAERDYHKILNESGYAPD